MYFINRIIEYLYDISDFFYDAGVVAYDWVYPFWKIGDPLFELSFLFYDLARRFENFGEWVDDVVDEITDILSWSNIRSLIRSWLPDVEDLIDWWDEWWLWIRVEIDLWWNVKRTTVQSWIADLETWAVGELNTLATTFDALIADVKQWAIGELNTLATTFDALIADVKLWAIGELNTFMTKVTALLAGVYNWAIGELNTLATTFDALIADVKLWAIGELNSLRATLEALDLWAMIQTPLATWWASRLIDIDSLAVTKLNEWFPFYNELSELWSSIAEFFTDPEDWLYKAFDRIIERFW